MKKIMFNDKYGLTKAVLDGRKTMTRRVINQQTEGWLRMQYDERYDDWHRRSPYMYIETLAIAQSYNKIGLSPSMYCEVTNDYGGTRDGSFDELQGWENKMFVKAELMPHHIKITNIRVERLQDISDEDCLREGIVKNTIGYYVEGLRCKDWEKESHVEMENGDTLKLFPTPREAFAALIDKVSGRGTWDSNPLVWVYEFELVD